MNDVAIVEDLASSRTMGSLPSSRYTSDEQWHLEREYVFRRAWLVAGRADTITRAGDFLVWSEFGESAVVSRTADGSLVGFHNVCQHRGARIVEQAGHCENGKFVCPWHGFTYDVNGLVSSVPRKGWFDPEHLRDLRAPTVAVTEWAGFVWINLAGDLATPFEDFIGPIGAEINTWGFQDWRMLGTETFTINANWKTVIEGFIEGYHILQTHNQSGSIPSHFRQELPTFTMYALHSSERRAYRTAEVGPGDEGYDFQAHSYSHYCIFPNVGMSCFQNNIRAYVAMPLDKSVTRFTAWALSRPDVSSQGSASEQQLLEGFDASQWENARRVLEEDVFVCEAAGRSRGSLAFNRVILNQEEQRILHLNDELDRYVARGSIRA
jgi:choline monooxygenase